MFEGRGLSAIIYESGDPGAVITSPIAIITRAHCDHNPKSKFFRVQRLFANFDLRYKNYSPEESTALSIKDLSQKEGRQM